MLSCRFGYLTSWATLAAVICAIQVPFAVAHSIVIVDARHPDSQTLFSSGLDPSKSVDVKLRLGESATITVIDNIGCKADIEVTQVSSRIDVLPMASLGPTTHQDFLVSLPPGTQSANINNEVLTIRWQGDGGTVMLGGDEVVCDEETTVNFSVNLMSAADEIDLMTETTIGDLVDDLVEGLDDVDGPGPVEPPKPPPIPIGPLCGTLSAEAFMIPALLGLSFLSVNLRRRS